MPENVDVILQAIREQGETIKDQGERAEKASERLGENISGMATAITKGFTTLQLALAEQDPRGLRHNGKNTYITTPLFIAVLAAIASPLALLLTSTSARIGEHESTKGHPNLSIEVSEALGGVERNREWLSEIDVSLQREMRDLISSEARQLESLDERLQHEMDLRRESDTVRMDELARRMGEAEHRQHEDEGGNAAQSERIKGLERMVFPQQRERGRGDREVR